MARKPKTPLTTIRTGNGDSGETFFSGKTVLKSDPAIELIGYLDHLNSHMGECGMSTRDVQKTLFVCGALLHTTDQGTANKAKEQIIDHRSALVEDVKNRYLALAGFVYPTGLPEERARTWCRITEQKVWKLREEFKIAEDLELLVDGEWVEMFRKEADKCETIAQFLNVLSDWLFVEGFEALQRSGDPQVWTGV